MIDTSRSIYEDVSGSPYRRIDGVMEHYCIGRNTAMKIGVEANAKIKIGKRVIYDLRKIDEYLEKLASMESDPADVEPIEDVIQRTKSARAEYNKHRDNIRNLGE